MPPDRFVNAAASTERSLADRSGAFFSESRARLSGNCGERRNRLRLTTKRQSIGSELVDGSTHLHNVITVIF